MDPRHPTPTQRFRWSLVAEDVFCPAAAAWGERRLTLFVRCSRGELLQRERDGQTWGELRSLGVPTARIEGSLAPVDWPIAACSTGDEEIHLLARGTEGDLLHGRCRRGDWSGFESIGVPVPPGSGGEFLMGLVRAPTACSRERRRMDVFAADASGSLLQTRWDGTRFSNCESLGPGSSSPADAALLGIISAFNVGSGAMGLVARAASGDLLLRWWNGRSWSPFAPRRAAEDLDPLDPGAVYTSPLSGPPAACGGGTARADAFARGPRGDLLHTSWNGKKWSRFEALGMPLSSSTSEPIPL